MSHLPYHAPEVARFNWMYGMRTYKPLLKQKTHHHQDESSQLPAHEDTWVPESPRKSSEKPATQHRMDKPESQSAAEPSAIPIADAGIENSHLVIFMRSDYSELDDASLLMQYPKGDLDSIPGSRPRPRGSSRR
ncbi:MAG: hypothetical protein ACKVT0_17535 [Planctomycetaceae bacterium]